MNIKNTALKSTLDGRQQEAANSKYLERWVSSWKGHNTNFQTVFAGLKHEDNSTHLKWVVKVIHTLYAMHRKKGKNFRDRQEQFPFGYQYAGRNIKLKWWAQDEEFQQRRDRQDRFVAGMLVDAKLPWNDTRRLGVA